MAQLNIAVLSDFVALAQMLWAKGYNSVDQKMRRSGLVKEVAIPAGSGNTRQFSEIDGQEYAALKTESDQSEQASVQQGYTSTMTEKRVARDIGISYEMRTQNKYPEVVARLENLGYQAANRLDLDLSHRFTFAASSTYTDMDGVSNTITTGDGNPLAYATHAVRGSSTTYRNILANNPRISKGALEAMERLCTEETINQFAEKMAIPFDILWTTDDPNSVNTAREYLQSTADPSQNNAGVMNVYQSKYRHVILPRVATDANGVASSTYRYYWGIASSMFSTFYLGVWEEPHLKTPQADQGEDFSTDDWQFGVRAGYGMCILNGGWCKFSKGDASA